MKFEVESCTSSHNESILKNWFSFWVCFAFHLQGGAYTEIIPRHQHDGWFPLNIVFLAALLYGMSRFFLLTLLSFAILLYKYTY